MEPSIPSRPEAGQPAVGPHLTPQFCFNTTALRDFLRLSRASIDDSLSLHLNALITPSRTPFLPNSTSSRPLIPNGAATNNRRQIPANVCRTFKNNILFPSWQMREDIFVYCNRVADTPNDAPQMPPAPRRIAMPSDKMGAEVSRGSPIQVGYSLDASTMGVETESSMGDEQSPKRYSKNYWGEKQIVDERTDPYSARDYSYAREGRSQILKDVLGSEEGVEKIIRARTWNLLAERCLEEPRVQGAGTGVASSSDYDGEWRAWRESRS